MWPAAKMELMVGSVYDVLCGAELRMSNGYSLVEEPGLCIGTQSRMIVTRRHSNGCQCRNRRDRTHGDRADRAREYCTAHRLAKTGDARFGYYL